MTTEEQRLFARLAVFAGGCTLAPAKRSAKRTSTRYTRLSIAAWYGETAPATRCLYDP